MNKFKIVMMFTLGVFLVSLCASETYSQATQRGRRPMPKVQPRAVADRLELTDEQIDQLKKLREQQWEIQKQFMEKTQTLREELGEFLSDPEPDATQIEKIRDELFNIRIEQMKASYMHRKEINKVYTPEQLKTLMAIKTRINRGRAAMDRHFPPRGQYLSRGMIRGRGRFMGPHNMPRRGVSRHGWFWRFRRR